MLRWNLSKETQRIIRSTTNQLTSRSNSNSDLNSGCWSLLIAGSGMSIFYFLFSLEFPVSNICEPQNLQDFFYHVLFHLKKQLLCCWKPKVSYDFPGAIEKLQWSIAPETWLCGNLLLMPVSPSDIWMFPKIVVFFHPNHPMFNRGFPLFSPSILGCSPPYFWKHPYFVSGTLWCRLCPTKMI